MSGTLLALNVRKPVPRRLLLAVVAAMIWPVGGSAEMQKIATVCQTGICFHWWPLLPEVPGWSHDREVSLHFGVNMQVPVGATFADAEAVIYAKGSYKPRMVETKSVADLIEKDKKEFLASTPDLEIVEVGPLTTKDGQGLRSFTFTPRSKGRWERVSYGEEGDFFLSFVVSAKSKEGLQHAMKGYIQFVQQYETTHGHVAQPAQHP